MNNSIKTKFAQIAIIGAPNVGKSSLLNYWLDTKVSIVSSKPHTTRNSIFGAVTKDETQVVFVDTPGFARTGGMWGTHLSESLENAFKDVEIILLVIDAKKPLKLGTEILLDLSLKSNKKVFVTIHKSDAANKNELIKVAQWVKDRGYTDSVFLTSTNNHEGVEELLAKMFEQTKEGAWLFHKGEKTNIKREWMGAECVREKSFYILHQEIPFNLGVLPCKWSFDDPKKPWSLHVDLVVNKPGHKKIVIGSKASVLKEIGSAARAELMTQWGKGSLFINVRVDKNFKDNVVSVYDSSYFSKFVNQTDKEPISNSSIFKSQIDSVAVDKSSELLDDECIMNKLHNTDSSNDDTAQNITSDVSSDDQSVANASDKATENVESTVDTSDETEMESAKSDDSDNETEMESAKSDDSDNETENVESSNISNETRDRSDSQSDRRSSNRPMRSDRGSSDRSDRGRSGGFRSDRGSSFGGDRGGRSFGSDRPSSGGFRSDRGPSDRGGFGGDRGRPSFGDRPSSGGFRSDRGPSDRGSRSFGGDRGGRSFGSDRPSGDRPSFGDRGGRSFGSDRPSGDRPRFNDRGDRGGRPSFGDRPSSGGFRSDRGSSFGGGRSFGSDRPSGDRGGFGGDRGRPSFGDRPSGDRPRFNDRGDRGGRSFGSDRPSGDRGGFGGDRGGRPSFGDKPRFNDRGDRGGRSFGSDRPSGDRPRFNDRGDRGGRPSFGDRPNRSDDRRSSDRPSFKSDSPASAPKPSTSE